MNERYKPHTYQGETPHEREPVEHDEHNAAHSETTPEQLQTLEIVNSINEELLRDIFAEYFQKAGSDISTMNWIPHNEVTIAPSPGDEYLDKAESISGSYDQERGIRLFPQFLKGDPSEILWTLIHEQLHAISAVKSRTMIEFDDTGNLYGEINHKSGLRRVTATQQKSQVEITQNLYEAINEGITELIAEKIFREYLKRSGDGAESTFGDWQKATARRYVMREYRYYWQFAQLYIALIAAVTEVPEEVAEKAILRSYLRNGDILPPELVEELAQRDANLPNELKDLFSVVNITDELDPYDSFQAVHKLLNDLVKRGVFSMEEYERLRVARREIFEQNNDAYDKIFDQPKDDKEAA